MTSNVERPAATVLIHSNRPVQERPASYGDYELITGWTADGMGGPEGGRLWEESMRRKYGRHVPRSRQIHQTAKYLWALEAGSNASTPLWVMIDTDTVVQCSGAEMARRFARFGTELVVSGEVEWWPKWQSHMLDPWKSPARGGGPLRYPCSGAIAGSKVGWTRLRAQLRRMPNFPCCPGFYRGAAVRTSPSGCVVGDQHCLQAAMQAPCSMADANRSQSCGEYIFEYKVDTTAQLFLSMSKVNAEHILRGKDGRFKYAPTGAVPCVLHFNGYSKDKLVTFARLANERPSSYDAWAVPKGNKYDFNATAN